MDIEDIYRSIEDVLEVDLPSKMAPRGKSFTSEHNPQTARWRCLRCDMESNLTGILRHQKKSGHIGKQRLLL